MTTFIDTHTHLDGEEFANDRPEVIARAKAAGVGSVFIPAIDVKSGASPRCSMSATNTPATPIP